MLLWLIESNVAICSPIRIKTHIVLYTITFVPYIVQCKATFKHIFTKITVVFTYWQILHDLLGRLYPLFSVMIASDPDFYRCPWLAQMTCNS